MRNASLNPSGHVLDHGCGSVKYRYAPAQRPEAESGLLFKILTDLTPAQTAQVARMPMPQVFSGGRTRPFSGRI